MSERAGGEGRDLGLPAGALAPEPPAPPTTLTPPMMSDWAVPGVTPPTARPTLPVALPAPLLPSPAVAAVQAAIRRLADDPVSAVGSVSPEQALVDLAALLSASAVLARVRIDRLADADRRQLHLLTGARSAATWLAQSGEITQNEIKVARKLNAYPTVAAALLTGTLTIAVAQKLQTALGVLRPHLDRPDGLLDGADADTAVTNLIVDGIRMAVAQGRGGFPTMDDPVLMLLLEELPAIAALPASQLTRLEHAFIVLAQHVEPAQLPGALDLLLSALLPSRLEDAADQAHARRSLSLTRDSDGTGWTLTGRLDLLTGERLTLVLDAALRTDPANPLDTTTAADLRQQGLDPHDPTLAPTLSPRSNRQRLHDALGAVLTSYLHADLAGSTDKNPVQLLITVTLPGLQDQPGALPAVTSTGTLLPPSTWQHLACGSSLTRQLLDLRGKVIETSHTSRTLKPHERRALHTQTGGTCQGAGCTRSTRHPGTVLHPHHTNPWARTGTTSLTDTAQLCDACHTHLHHDHPLRLKDGRLLGPHGWISE